MAKTITKVIQAAAIDGGHAIRLNLEFDDGSREEFKCDAMRAPTLIQALLQSATGAERLRKAAPGQPVETIVPYRATDCRAGSSPDGTISLQYSTEAVVPVQIAMNASLAQKTIELLTGEIAALGTQPPLLKN